MPDQKRPDDPDELETGTPESEASTAAASDSPEARWVGKYRLLEIIGEGGMGTVWLAEQREPIKRHVALKVIKLGMDTKAVIARFETERQAMAMMDHPCIATLSANVSETPAPLGITVGR